MLRCGICNRNVVPVGTRWMMMPPVRGNDLGPQRIDFRSVEVELGTPGAVPVCWRCAVVRTHRPAVLDVVTARNAVLAVEQAEWLGECQRRGQHQWAETSTPELRFCTQCLTTAAAAPELSVDVQPPDGQPVRSATPGADDRVIFEHPDGRFSVHRFGPAGERTTVAAGLASESIALAIARRGLPASRSIWSGKAADPDRVAPHQPVGPPADGEGGPSAMN